MKHMSHIVGIDNSRNGDTQASDAPNQSEDDDKVDEKVEPSSFITSNDHRAGESDTRTESGSNGSTYKLSVRRYPVKTEKLRSDIY